MKTIWKFPLEPDGFMPMPQGAEVLCVQVQNETPCLWALVDPNAAEKETRVFRIYGTGHQIHEQASLDNYIGTFQLQGGLLIFHVFETTNQR